MRYTDIMKTVERVVNNLLTKSKCCEEKTCKSEPKRPSNNEQTKQAEFLSKDIKVRTKQYRGMIDYLAER